MNNNQGRHAFTRLTSHRPPSPTKAEGFRRSLANCNPWVEPAKLNPHYPSLPTADHGKGRSQALMSILGRGLVVFPESQRFLYMPMPTLICYSSGQDCVRSAGREDFSNWNRHLMRLRISGEYIIILASSPRPLDSTVFLRCS